MTDPTPSTPISTSNGSGGGVNTRKASNETTAAWVERHFQNVLSEWEGGGFALGNSLTTTWKAASGQSISHTSNRNQGEGDGAYLGRHATEATALMAPPDNPVP